MVQVSDQDASRSLLLDVFRACPSGRRPKDRPRTHWRDSISLLAWEHFGVPKEELESIAGEKEAWNTLLSLLPPQFNFGEGENGWMDESLVYTV